MTKIEYASEGTILTALSQDPSVWSIAEAMALIESAVDEVKYEDGCYDWMAGQVTPRGWLRVHALVIH